MLSQRGRYALKAMINLAGVHGGQPKQVSLLAAEEHIPRKFLEAIMSDLRQAGLVESARGKHGGYRLSRAADRIMFGEIMRVTDGPLAPLPCVSVAFYRPCDDCDDEGACMLRRVMGRARQQISDVLDRTSLADARGSGTDAALAELGAAPVH